LTDRRDWRLWSISATVFALTALTGSEPVLVIVGAGLLMILLDARPRIRLRRRKPPDDVAGTDDRPKPMPMLVGLGTMAGAGTLASLAWFFLKTGAIVFGSGLAIVPFMRAGVVDHHHWLTNSQFLDSVAIGLITPGPVVISAGFIGYLVAGLPGAIISSIAIFTPIYLGIVVPGRWFLRHRDNAQLRAFVAGATAAAAGALCGAVATLGLLWRFKIKEPYVVLATGALGILLH
jgi:chromate transporter